MFPDNELSNTPVVSGFNFPVKTSLSGDLKQDWELGGIDINDPSAGLEYQLWHFTLEVDEITGDSDVYVEAPSVAKTLLFTGSYMTEIAGCFDQNMNPMVAYMESGDPKIWWWDPTITSMAHTAMPAGSIDLRCTLDDKRNFNISDSDIVLSYVRGGALYFRLQRDRYLVEYLLFDEGSIERLISLAMNSEWRLQWRLMGQAESEFAVSVAEPFLGDVVYDLCRMAGIKPENIDVSDLYRPTDIVPGIKIDVDDGFDKPIEWLMEIYQFTKSQYNKKLVFKHLGQPVGMRIPYNHLVVNGNDLPLKQSRIDGKKLPSIVNISHIDSTGGFAKNQQSASRRSNMFTSDEATNIESRIVLTPDLAATAALTILKANHAEQYKYEFSTTIRYTELTPSDVIEVEDQKGFWHRVRIEEKNEDDRVIDWECIQDAGELVYGNSAALGKALEIPISTTPGLVGDTILEILNLPIQRDQDDELGLYIAAKGSSSGWNGYALYFSVDLGVNYTQAYISDQASNIGETATSITDVGTSVEVLVPYPLESINSTQLAAGYNRAVIGDEEIQFLTATLIGMVGTQYHYNLTGIVRGVLHTYNLAWAASTRFVMVDESVIFARIQREFYGFDLYYKAVSLGQSLDDAAPLAYLFSPAWSQTEWPVTNVVVTAAEGGGLLVTWDGSPRLGTFGLSPFHSKYMVGYRVKFADGHIVDTLEETVTYTGGALGTVVEVYALNSITGEGMLADGSGGGTTPTTGDPMSDPQYIETWQERSVVPDWPAGEPIYLIADGRDYWVFKGQQSYSYCLGALALNVNALNGQAGNTANNTAMKFKGVALTAHTSTAAAKFLSDLAADEPHGGFITDSITWGAKPSFSMLNWWKRRAGYGIGMPAATIPGTKIQFLGESGGGMESRAGFTTGKCCGQFVVTGYTSGYIYLQALVANPDMVESAGTVPNSYQLKIFNDGTFTIAWDAATGDLDFYEGATLLLSTNLPITLGQEGKFAITGSGTNAVVHCNFGNEAWDEPLPATYGGLPNAPTIVGLSWNGIGSDAIISDQGYHGASRFVYGGTGPLLATFGMSTGNHHVEFEDSSRTDTLRYGLCLSGHTGELGVTGTSIGYRNSNATERFHVLKWTWGGGGELILPAGFGTAESGLVHSRPTRVAYVYNASANTIKVYIKEDFSATGWYLWATLTSVPANNYFPARWVDPMGGTANFCVLSSLTDAPTGADDWTLTIP